MAQTLYEASVFILPFFRNIDWPSIITFVYDVFLTKTKWSDDYIMSESIPPLPTLTHTHAPTKALVSVKNGRSGIGWEINFVCVCVSQMHVSRGCQMGATLCTRHIWHCHCVELSLWSLQQVSPAFTNISSLYPLWANVVLSELPWD